MVIPLSSLVTPQTVFFDSNPEGLLSLGASPLYAPLVWNNQTVWLVALRCIPKTLVALMK